MATKENKKKSVEETLYPLIYDNAPSDLKKVQNTWLLLSIGLFAQLAWAFFFIFTSWSSYSAKMTSPFLSLEVTAGNCKSVTITNTKTAHIDVNGHWDTASGFDSTASAYAVWFNEFEADSETWDQDMLNLASAVNEEIDYLKSISDLPTKLLHLSSWRKTVQAGKTGKYTVMFNADPQWIFKMTSQNLDTTIGKPSDDCDPQDVWSYENGKYDLGFPYWDGSANSNGGDDFDDALPGTYTYNSGNQCPSFIPEQLGYKWAYPTEEFNLIFDVRTSMTIAALNASIITADDLVYTTQGFYNMETDSKSWRNMNMSVMYDPKFPGMDPVYFYNGIPAQRFGGSALKFDFGGYYYYGSDYGNYLCPSQCETDDKYCSIPDLVLSFSPFESGSGWAKILGDNTNQFELNAYSAEIMRVNDGQWDPGFIGCATNTPGSYKYDNETKTGKLGHMEPTSSADFEANLMGTKPFKIQETYYECLPRPLTAFLDSVGVAQGNAGLYTGLLVTAIAMILGLAPAAWGWLKPSAENSTMDLTGLHLAKICAPDALDSFDAQKDAMMENLAKALAPALASELKAAKSGPKIRGTSLDAKP